MNPEDFTMTLKYAATLVSEYFVRNDLELWETICSNGLFDIWHPSAPHQRFAQADSHPANFRILLLRIYEIDHEFGPSDITHASSRIDHLASPIRDVGTKAPLISDERFDGVRGLLERSVKPYLTCPLPPKSSTTMDGQPFPDPAIAEHGKTTGDILLPQDKNPSGVVVAFEMLLGEIESEIDLLSRAGAAAFERRDYGSVQKALERVSELTAYVNPHMIFEPEVGRPSAGDSLAWFRSP